MNVYKKFKILRKAFLTKYWQTFYSQFGEDVILRQLVGRKKSKGIYVDVGCYHPKKFSNTYMLHKFGWSGINIDMENDKISLFRLLRPRDFNVVAAVSDTQQEVTIYKDRDFSLGTTINPLMNKTMKSYTTETMRTRTLNQIIESSPFRDNEIDVLSIDCEGHDLQVLKSIDLSKYVPKIIVIEDHSNYIEDVIKGDIYKYLIHSGYKLKSWMHLSLIFTLVDGAYDH